MGKESLSFKGVGMEFVSASDSERKRERIHYFPPQSPLSHEEFRSILRSTVYNSIPKRIFIRNEDNYWVIDPKELCDIKNLPIHQRRRKFNNITEEMYWSEEVIIENANPEKIEIANLPQVLFEPLEAAA